ncbi:MAG: RimK/LysX family protein [Alphaproteobacteria bacterium]|nr:RimK/LysX family protein [Alphaproteobacteria bacterium]
MDTRSRAANWTGTAVGLCAIMAMGTPVTAIAAERMITVGAAETVRIYPGGAVFKARVDTGATTSSINARKIKRFKRGGKRWVRFEVVGKQGQNIAMERPVVRTVRIKRFGQESKRRAVVRIGICMGGYYKDAQVTLQDRSRREYPVLIGRRYMTGAILVDPGREYLVKPNCPGRK